MFREMRRKDRAILPKQAEICLESGEYGVLSTVGADGQPYATPLSFVMIGDALYFHCAQEGQKLDNIAFESRVCFCVVGRTQPVYEQNFSTYFESVIVYGKAGAVTEADEKASVLTALAKKYLPRHMDKAPGDIAKSLGRTAVYKITIEHMTGKAKRNKGKAEQ